VDAAGRYGGEELLLILPEATLEGARAAAERVRAAIAECVVEYDGERLRVTASAGCATLVPGVPRNADQLMYAADAALYRAKKLGRDRVEVETDVEDSGAEKRVL
jgi:diguanylate cyclase (GGDEF)-like protein